MRAVRRQTGFPLRAAGFIAVAVAMVIGVWYYGFGAVIGSVAQPLSRAGSWIATTFRPASSTRALTAERDDLRAQLLAVTTQLTEAQRKLETVSTLEQLEDFLQQQPYTSTVASVIAYSPDPGVQSVVIQRGRAHGLAPGQAVVTEHGVVIGTLSRVDAQTSIVRLVTDSQSQLLAKVQNDAQSRGIVSGERGLSLAMKFLPRNDQVTKGQTVVTSGLDPNIPPDLLIGTVEDTAAQAGELFQTAVIKSPVEFQRLRAVAVIQSPL